QTPRAVHHLAFVPEADCLLAAADFGLVIAFDLSGRCLWQDRLVAHLGSLGVDGPGTRVVLACFTDGLRLYDRGGTPARAATLPQRRPGPKPGGWVARSTSSADSMRVCPNSFRAPSPAVGARSPDRAPRPTAGLPFLVAWETCGRPGGTAPVPCPAATPGEQ